MKREEVLYVHAAHDECQDTEANLNRPEITDEQEHIQPRRHEGKVGQATDKNERPGNGHNPHAILEVD